MTQDDFKAYREQYQALEKDMFKKYGSVDIIVENCMSQCMQIDKISKGLNF